MRPGRFRSPGGIPPLLAGESLAAGVDFIAHALLHPRARARAGYITPELPTMHPSPPPSNYAALQFRKDLTDPERRERDLENLAELRANRPLKPPRARALEDDREEP